jgi:DNA processing protein
MHVNADLQAELALTMVPMVGIATARQLIAHCGSASEIFSSKKESLMAIDGIGPQIAHNIKSFEVEQATERELRFIEDHRVTGLFFSDPRFPNRLRQTADCPMMIFVLTSDIKLLDAPRILSVVGTRKPTEQGTNSCEIIIEGLKSYGVVVISGLAHGVDGIAHRKATQAGIPNFGVMGHGLNMIYPPQHRDLATRMLQNGGLITEYLHNATPEREHFPQRNRIITGLCDALLVIETAESGGSMISVTQAAKQARDIFAVPGYPRMPKSSGCNALIKAGTARLVESADDIAEFMRWTEHNKPTAVQTRLLLDLPEEQMALVQIIRNRPEIAIDDLCIAAKRTPSELASLLIQMEFGGIIKTLPGKRYILI